MIRLPNYGAKGLGTIVCLAAINALVAAPVSAQKLVADYQFRNVLTSSVGKAPALTDIAKNTFGTDKVHGQQRPVLLFPELSGVELSNATTAIPADHYSILLDFRFDETTNWRRILDFKNGVGDPGLYNKDGRLEFYNFSIGTDAIFQPNTWVQVLLTRDRQKTVCGYVDGKLQFTFIDQGDNAVISDANKLRFFRDDGDNENSGGAVARIRLYDAPLTVAQLDQRDKTSLVSATRREHLALNANGNSSGQRRREPDEFWLCAERKVSAKSSERS